LTEIFKEQLKLSQFEKTMRKTYDPATEGTNVQETVFDKAKSKFVKYMGFGRVRKGYKPTRSGRIEPRLSPTPQYNLKTFLIQLESAMFRVVLLCLLPTIIVFFAHSVFSLDEFLMRPQYRKIERLEYQIELLRNLEAEQIEEIENLKISKNINIEAIVTSKDFEDL